MSEHQEHVMEEETAGGAAPTVDEALLGFRDMLATDGYELRWSLSSPGTVLVRVVAGEGACADCLVPRPLMEGILSDALGPTGYALDRVVLPADG
jgi:hypothetical protein